MTGYLVSLFMGLAVGVAYGLVQVRSPAPPLIALWSLRHGAGRARGRIGETSSRVICRNVDPRSEDYQYLYARASPPEVARASNECLVVQSSSAS